MTPLQPQWGAIGAVLPVLVVVFSGGIFRGLRAKDIVYKRYSSDRLTTRSAIEGNAIIPALEALVGDVSDRVLADGVDVATSLQRIGYRPALARLSGYYGDLSLLEAVPREIKRYMQAESASLSGLVLGALLVVAPYCVSGLVLAVPVITLGYVFVGVGLITTLALGFLEASTRNRLVSLFERYEDFQLDG
jgi:hypothetical protein